MKKYKNKIDDGFNSELVAKAMFDGEMEIPIIEDTNPEIPTKLIPFSKINYSRDYSEYIMFYENDLNFGDVIANPQKYVDVFKKFKGIICPDNSLYIDSPFTVQIGNIYKSRALGHFFQQQNIPVIANCRWGDKRTYTKCILSEKVAFLGIPKHSIVAIGTYGCTQSKEEKTTFKEGLEQMLIEIEPRAVIVYGSLSKDIFNDFLSKTKFIQFDDWTTSKRRR